MDLLKRLKELTLPDPLIRNDGTRVSTREEYAARCEEIRALLMHEIYGIVPPKPEHLRVESESTDCGFAAGKASLSNLKFTVTLGEREASFRVKSVLPTGKRGAPAIIYIADTDEIPNKFLPAEEIIDRGYALFIISQRELTPPCRGVRFSDRLTPMKGGLNSPGTLAVWAWCAMRVMDYLVGREEVDKNSVAVCGHGVFGICALIASGFDERFKFVIANCAGTLGTALSRGKTGESPEIFTERHPELFSRRFVKNREPFDKRKYDQNFLLFLSLDRHILIGSAERDASGDPMSERLCILSLSNAISLIYDQAPPQDAVMAADAFTIGKLSYHLRDGVDYFSRDDWNIYLDYVDKNI